MSRNGTNNGPFFSKWAVIWAILAHIFAMYLCYVIRRQETIGYNRVFYISHIKYQLPDQEMLPDTTPPTYHQDYFSDSP